MNAAGHALALHQRGFAPLPLAPRSKQPASGNGWPSFEFDPSAAEQWFKEDANVGVILGQRSGGLIDVDIDCDEAARLMHLLPSTGATFGRQSRPVSHALYFVTGSTATKKFYDPVRVNLAKQGGDADKAMIIELRGDGGQTMFPGSIHPNDGPVTWVDDGEPATVTRAELEAGCIAIVRAVLAERYGDDILDDDVVQSYLHSLAPTREIPLSERAKAKASPASKNRKAPYGNAALEDECERVRGSANGTRNDQLYASALKIGSLISSGCVNEGDALGVLLAAARDAGLNQKEATMTIRSGFNIGKNNPRDPQERPRAKDIASSPSSGEDTETPWPRLSPINAELPPVLAFDAAAMLPAEWRDHLADKADRLQARIDLLAVPAVSAYGSVLGSRVRLRLKAYDRSHAICPNGWGAVIDSPSSGKSPSMTAALAPLYYLQEKASEAHVAYLKEKAVKDERIEMQRSAAKKRAQKELEKEGGEDKAEEILKSRPGEPEKDPPVPCAIVNTTTVPKLGVTLNDNPNGVLLFQDELSGFLASIDGEEKQEDRAFYLKAYNGTQPHQHDTISRGSIFIKNTCVTILGGIQPSKIAPIVRGAITGASDDGLIQRFQLAVYPDPNKTWDYVDRDDNPQWKDSYFGSFRSAYEYSHGLDAIAYWRFSPEAQDMFAAWYTNEMKAARCTPMLGALQGHIIKMDKTVGSLALIFEIADGGRDGIVGVDAIQRALAWVPYLKSHANRIYASADTTPAIAARELINRRKHLDAGFTAANILRKGWGFGLNDREIVFEALDILIAEGYLRGQRSKTCTSGGRPTANFYWHPGLDAYMAGARDDG
jgi:hypothetical protein